jgi:hypothetical protein
MPDMMGSMIYSWHYEMLCITTMDVADRESRMGSIYDSIHPFCHKYARTLAEVVSSCPLFKVMAGNASPAAMS